VIEIALDRLVEGTCFNAIQRGKVAIEHDPDVANFKDQMFHVGS